jgi:sentrin-specific protease 1
MKGFKLKLVAILISSFLNIRRGCPLFPRNDDGSGSPNDVVDPKQRTTTPSNGKRDREGNCIVGQQGTPNIIITQ